MRPSAEGLLISSLVTTHDAHAAAIYGISPEMFVGYQAEYRWLLSYTQTYGSCPTRDALLSKFPEFPYVEHADVAFAADEVRYTHNQREIRRAVRSAAQSVAAGDYEEAALALGSYSPFTATKPLVNALQDMSFLTSYEEKPDSLRMPWRTLQEVTGGMRAGDLWYGAARLGNGKSWKAIEVAAHALEQGRRVSLYSLEMPKAQILVRLHVCLGRRLGLPVDHKAMRDKIYDLIAYRKLVNQIRDEITGEIFIFDASDGKISPATVASRAADVDLSIIDYVGLMSSPLGKRAIDDWRVIAAISNELKEIATAKSTRIFALSQVNRDGDTVSKYPPKVKNLAQSDALGQDGDVVLTHKKFSKTSQVCSIEKNRHGASEVLYFTRFLPNEGSFHEISRDTAEDLRDQEGTE